MKRKLFTLLTLLLTVCSGAWADETYYLQKTDGTGLTGDFYTTAPLTFSANQTYDAITYEKGLTFQGNCTSISGNNYPDRMVQYDCKTTSTELTFVVYSQKSSASNFYIYDVKESALGTANTVPSELTTVSAAANSITTKTYTVNSSTRASVYITLADRKNTSVVQIIATEKGTPHVAPCEDGYSFNFNKGRLVARSGSSSMIDGTIEIHQNQNFTAGYTTSGKMQTNGTNYIKFSVASPMVLNLTTSSTTQYNVSNTKGTDDNKITPTANEAKSIPLKSAGTYYINPQGSNINPTGLSFSAAPVITYDANGGSGSMDNTCFTIADNGYTAPTGQVFDGWKDGEGTDYTVGDDVEANVTLYAQWKTPAVTHHVTYDLNGATGTLPTQDDVEENEDFTVAAAPGDLVAPTGQRFKTWNDGSADYAPGATYRMGTSDVILTAQYENIYAITKDTPINGTISVSATEAAEGEVVTLTATPSEDYLFDSWSVYKTGEPATTITVSDNKFTMPAYAVTVNATFIADTRAKVLYVTSDGTVNSGDDLYAALNEDYNVTLIDYNGSATVTNYKLVVLHESIAGSNYNAGLVEAAKSANVPLLNTKSYFYNTDRWNWGTPNAGKSENVATLNTEYSNIESHPIFAGLTVNSNQIEVVGTAAAKAMQPIGSFTSGYEGYTLAKTSNNNDSSLGTAIHELTPAQRGVASAKYLLISVSNDKLNDLSDDGKRLFKNAAAYLIDGSASWTPTVAVSTLSGRNYATCVTTKKLDFAAADGITAYIATGFNGAKDAIVLQSVDIVDAGTPIIVKTTTQGATVNVPVTTADASSTKGNALVAGDGTTAYDGTTGYTYYYIASDQFHKATSGTLQSGKAYLMVDNDDVPAAARAFGFVFEDEGEVTGIHSVSNSVLTTDQVFDLQGRRVAQPTKGLYIMNGRKVIFK